MPQESGKHSKRINIDYFEGVNSLVSHTLAKKTELIHAENARSKTIGSIEKREGQTVLGKNSSGQPFITTQNSGLFYFSNELGKTLYRASATESPTLSINVFDWMPIDDGTKIGGVGFNSKDIDYKIAVYDTLTVSEKITGFSNSYDFSFDKPVTLYYLNGSDRWTPLTGDGAAINGGVFSHTLAEGNIFLANYNDANRYIKSDGTTVVDSTDGTGHLFNTPQPSKINYYKNRLYLADFNRDNVRYPTTILRSSMPMGIVALFNSDYTNISSGATIDVTDTKYMYTDSGANTYDIYRGGTQVKDDGGAARTLTVTTRNETSVVVTWSGGDIMTFQASDEIWISGTYTGKKVFRWVNNPSITGRDFKQYDTFKLAGGGNDPITMLENIGNVMMVANRNTLSSWNDYTLEGFDLDIGCVSKNGYVKTLGTLFFLGYSGVYQTTGSAPQIISNKIERYITGATATGKEACAAGKKGHSIFFTLGDVTLYKPDGSVDKLLKDVCLEFNIVQQTFYIHTNIKASQFETFVEESDSDKCEFIDTSGDHAVKEFLSGSTDNGKEIHFRIDTNRLTLQKSYENVNNLVSLLVETDRGASIQAFVDLNNKEEFFPIEGEIVKGISNLKITNKAENRGKPPIARLVSISLRDSSKQICKISRMSLIFSPTENDVPDNV